MTYTILYDGNGNPNGVSNYPGLFIPISMDVSRFRDFLVWNAKQAEPLDWKTPKEMPAPTPPPLSVEKRLDKLSDLLVIKGIFTQEDLDKVNSYDLVP